MKKNFIIGFILLGIVAKGDIGTDIKENQIILDNIKAENVQLRDKIKNLNEILDRLEINLVKETKFQGLGIEIRRDMESFTLKIIGEDLRQGKYDNILDDFIKIIKYDPEGPITFVGNDKNINFLNSFFIDKKINPARITLEIKGDDQIDLGKEGIKVVETKIILGRIKS